MLNDYNDMIKETEKDIEIDENHLNRLKQNY